MDKHLTEITNAYLFTEYLQCSGIRVPKLRDEWEHKVQDRVMARIKKGQGGRLQFFICAASIGRKA
jgi:hypothetical protein